MTDSTDQIQYTPYGPDRFPSHLPFARRGYLFTVPGEFPQDTPGYINPTDWEMAVYRKHGEWEVRDVNRERRIWGFGPTRRAAAGSALQGIARERRYRAADIATKRTAAGLEAVPPYQVEVTAAATLVLSPHSVTHLASTEPSEEDPTAYVVNHLDGGGRFTIKADSTVSLRSFHVGVLHIRCGCNPDTTVLFENESDALVYVHHHLAAWGVCPKSPGTPGVKDQ
ncbi:MAG TPA: hypothetical protein VIU15_27790 [Streptomyces sp.]